MLHSKAALLFVCLLSLTAATVAVASPYDCGSCPGHYVMQSSTYPFGEDILLNDITIDNNWQPILTGCFSANGGAVNLNGVNYHAGAATNAHLRGYMALKSGSAGIRYEVRFVRKAVGSETILDTIGWYVRQIQTGEFDQGEFFFSTRQNLPAGQHRFELQARAIDSGSTFTVGPRWMAVQGVPSDNVNPGISSRFPSDSSTLSGTYQIGGSWSPNVASTLTFSNTEPVDVFPEAYFEINGGTEGDQITVGFGLDNEPTSRRNSDFAVPKTFDLIATRHGVNISDFLEDVPAGTHTLKLWAISRSGRTVDVSWRNIEFVSIPAKTSSANPGGSLAVYPIPGITPPSSVVVDSYVPLAEKPVNPDLSAFNGNWYPITAEIQMPADPAGVSWLDWTGAGYIELLGRSGAWTDARAEVVIETYHWDPAQGKYMYTDMMFVPVHIPAGRGNIYFFSDAFAWGNTYGNKVRIWMRKISPSSGETFTVGKVYMGMKLLPTDNGQCFYH